jgi:SAM-dependent methyltransferase
MDPERAVAESWNDEYRAGRYLHEPPVAFVSDIVAAARQRRILRGLYLGCGNGRNFVPLTEAGLDLVGVDLSEEAVRQLRLRLPSRAHRIWVGDLASLEDRIAYPLVIGIQVLQHGDRRWAGAAFARAQALTALGGLLCVRVNASGSEREFAYDVTESGPGESETIVYREGPKRGLTIHYYSLLELEGLVSRDFTPVLGPRRVREARAPPSTGSWYQWEAIWERIRPLRAIPEGETQPDPLPADAGRRQAE